MVANVKQRHKSTAPSVATAMGAMSVGCVSVIRVVWAHDVSAQWRTTARLMMYTAYRSQTAQFAVGEGTVCAANVPAIQMSSVRCGESTANVMTSTACASKGHFALVSTYINHC